MKKSLAIEFYVGRAMGFLLRLVEAIETLTALFKIRKDSYVGLSGPLIVLFLALDLSNSPLSFSQIPKSVPKEKQKRCLDFRDATLSFCGKEDLYAMKGKDQEKPGCHISAFCPAKIQTEIMQTSTLHLAEEHRQTCLEAEACFFKTRKSSAGAENSSHEES